MESIASLEGITYTLSGKISIVGFVFYFYYTLQPLCIESLVDKTLDWKPENWLPIFSLRVCGMWYLNVYCNTVYNSQDVEAT